MSVSTQAVSHQVEAKTEQAEHRRKIFGAIFGVALAIVLRLLPTPHGLTPVGHSILAILALTVSLWVFEVFPNAITSVLMLALMIMVGVKPAIALSAFSEQAYWILVVVLFYGYAMQSTGLARRLSFVMLNLFPATYPGILGALFLIGLILSLGVPSMTVRTAIMTPIAWALVQALGIEPKGRGSALIMISTVEMAVIPGCATLLGSLWGPLMITLFSKRGLDLQWVPWARAMFLPTVIWSVLLLVGNYLSMKPEREITVGKAFARAELAKLGRMSRHELATTIIVILSIVYWITGSLHHLPTYVIGMFAMAAFTWVGILREKDFGGAVNWSLLLFLGAVFGLPNIIEQNKVTDWVADLIVPLIAKVSGNVLIFCVTLLLVMMLLRFTDPSGFLIMTVVFLTVSSIMKNASISPIVIVASILMGAHPFWAMYQNFWVALMHGLTGNQSSTGGQRVRLSNVHAVASLLALAIAVGYWRLIGLWH